MRGRLRSLATSSMVLFIVAYMRASFCRCLCLRLCCRCSRRGAFSPKRAKHDLYDSVSEWRVLLVLVKHATSAAYPLEHAQAAGKSRVPPCRLVHRMVSRCVPTFGVYLCPCRRCVRRCLRW